MRGAAGFLFVALLTPIISIADPCPTTGQFELDKFDFEENPRLIQRTLAFLGSWPQDQAIDGSMGPLTRDSIANFQTSYQLAPSARFDTQTQKKIAELLAIKTPFPFLVENKTTSFYKPNFTASTTYEDGKCTIHLDFDNDELDQDYQLHTPFECRIFQKNGHETYIESLDTIGVGIQLKRHFRPHSGMLDIVVLGVRPDGETGFDPVHPEEFEIGYEANLINSDGLSSELYFADDYADLKEGATEIMSGLTAFENPPPSFGWTFRRWDNHECLY